MKARIEADVPFYFGPGRELFGFFHPAVAAAGTAVLLCYPLGAEQIRCHRLYRQLAHALSESGFPVLRFDYFGTGDSAGRSADVDWARCVADVATAAGELRMRSGCPRLLAFGARLGANAALAAAAARFEGVVAWDAIDDGAALVRGLDAMQQALKLDLNRFDRARPALDVSAQWPGSDVSDTLRAQLAGLRLPPSPDLPVAWLASASEGDAHAGAAIEVEPRWDDIDRLELTILSHPLIDAARRHLREMS